MANVVVADSAGILTVVPDGVDDFDMATYFPNGVYLRAIQFTESNAADKLYVRAKSATGVQFISDGLEGGDQYVEVEPKRRFPYIKASDCTFTTPADCLISIFFD